MTVQTIGNYLSCDMKMKRAGKKTTGTAVDTSSSKKIKNDTYETSPANDRKKLLDTVKKKIRAGYYNSREVTEDLSDSFARVFNNIS